MIIIIIINYLFSLSSGVHFSALPPSLFFFDDSFSSSSLSSSPPAVPSCLDRWGRDPMTPVPLLISPDLDAFCEPVSAPAPFLDPSVTPPHLTHAVKSAPCTASSTSFAVLTYSSVPPTPSTCSSLNSSPPVAPGPPAALAGIKQIDVSPHFLSNSNLNLNIIQNIIQSDYISFTMDYIRKRLTVCLFVDYFLLDSSQLEANSSHANSTVLGNHANKQR